MRFAPFDFGNPLRFSIVPCLFFGRRLTNATISCPFSTHFIILKVDSFPPLISAMIFILLAIQNAAETKKESKTNQSRTQEQQTQGFTTNSTVFLSVKYWFRVNQTGKLPINFNGRREDLLSVLAQMDGFVQVRSRKKKNRLPPPSWNSPRVQNDPDNNNSNAPRNQRGIDSRSNSDRQNNPASNINYSTASKQKEDSHVPLTNQTRSKLPSLPLPPQTKEILSEIEHDLHSYHQRVRRIALIGNVGPTQQVGESIIDQLRTVRRNHHSIHHWNHSQWLFLHFKRLS